MVQEVIISFFQDIAVLLVFSIIFIMKQKGIFSKFFEYFPDKSFFFKLNARLELIELNIETINRKLMQVQNEKFESVQKHAFQNMRKT